MENKIKIPYMSHKQNSAADPNPILPRLEFFYCYKKNQQKQTILIKEQDPLPPAFEDHLQNEMK